MSSIIGAKFDEDIDTFWALKQEGKNNYSSLINLGYPPSDAKNYNNLWIEKIEDIEILKLDELIIDIDLINHLSKEFNLVLLTARKLKHHVFAQLKWLGLTEYFHEIFVVNPINVTEEKAVILKSIAASLYVGDTESDMKAAKLANVKFIPVSSGMRSRCYFAKNGYEDYIIESINQLKDFHV